MTERRLGNIEQALWDPSRGLVVHMAEVESWAKIASALGAMGVSLLALIAATLVYFHG